jgi:hypothetical protein
MKKYFIILYQIFTIMNATSLLIYGISMLFIGLITLYISNKLFFKGGVEGMVAPNAAPSTTMNSPTPVPTGIPASSNSKNQPKTSACGDDCSTYDQITATLKEYERINNKFQQSDEATKKVDSDLIKLSKNIKNMGSKKTPGGRPPVNHKSLS